MQRYMLDTDICSYVMKRSNELLLKRLQKVPVRTQKLPWKEIESKGAAC
jgi:predicted nucleic acid-binding protein